MAGCGEETLVERDVSGPLSIDGFGLVSISSDELIPGYEDLQSGDEIDLSSIPPFTLVAFSDDAGSVQFDLNGKINARTENVAPFALQGDTNGDFRSAWNAGVGSHSVSATAFAGGNRTGASGPTYMIELEMVDGQPPEPPPPEEPEDLAIDAFALVSINSDAVIPGYEDLQDGDTIDVGQLPAFTLIARSDDAKSVRFGLDGNANYRTENIAPFSLTGDSGGDYTAAWKPGLGVHRVSATASGPGGATGATRSVGLEFVDSDDSDSDGGDHPSESGLCGPSDLIALHYDHAPDRDDGHSAAADRSILQSEFSCSFIGQRTLPVSGTYGTNASTFNTSSDAVMDAVFNPCGGWISAHRNWNDAVSIAVDEWVGTLQDGGDVCVKEGGQSDFTADVVARIQAEYPEFNTRTRIHVVQHSGWNENKTTASDLSYVKGNTHYIRISDANSYLVRSGGDDGFEAAALAHPQFGPSWEAAFDYYSPNARLDFSDTGELMYIVFGPGGEFGIDEFLQRYLD